MENKETVVNPIKILCEEAGVYKLPPEKRPQRVLEISKDYRKMLKRYEEEKGIK